MVAIIGYPGEQKHTWERFTSRAAAQAWLAKTGDSLLTANPAWPAAIYSQRILSEKEAAKIRYRDGRRCYPVCD